MNPNKVYIAGPMRGHVFYNFPAFYAAEKRLRALSYDVVNPAALDTAQGFNPYALHPQTHDWSTIPSSLTLDDIITRDIAALRTCGLYYLLEGWEKSTGAAAEKAMLDWQGSKRLLSLDSGVFVPFPVAGATATTTGETIVTDTKTGGQKGQKLQRFDLIPGEPLTELAEVYGRGAKKYADDNWRKGYSWKLSFGALNRHLWRWWMGEQRDELGNHHLACVAWHAFTLMWYELFKKGTDDRPLAPASALTPTPV